MLEALLARDELTRPPSSVVRIGAAHTLGLALWRIDRDLARGAELFLETFESVKEDDEPVLVAEAHGGLSYVRASEGRLDEALVSIDRAIDVYTRSGGPADDSWLVARLHRASLLSLVGRFDEADRESQALVHELTGHRLHSIALQKREKILARASATPAS